MVATPTFVAPMIDTLTGDRVRSSVDSLLQSTPLWAFESYVGPSWPDRFDQRLYKLIAGSVFVVGTPPNLQDTRGVPPLPSDAFLTGLGGSHNAVWMVDSFNEALYKVAPAKWSVIASRTPPHPSTGTSPRKIGGNASTAWFWNFHPRYSKGNPPWQAHDLYTLYRLDGTQSTLPVVASKSFRYLQSIDGDSTVAWGIHRDVNTGDVGREFRNAELIRIDADLNITDSVAVPLRADGHWAIGIAGSRHSIHLHTWDVARDELWLHRLSPSSYGITQTYGPFSIENRLTDIGGD